MFILDYSAICSANGIWNFHDAVTSTLSAIKIFKILMGNSVSIVFYYWEC